MANKTEVDQMIKDAEMQAKMVRANFKSDMAWKFFVIASYDLKRKVEDQEAK